MPTEIDGLEKLVASLTSNKIEEYTRSMENLELNPLGLPKFRIENKLDLKKILENMGLTLPFKNFTLMRKISNISIKV